MQRNARQKQSTWKQWFLIYPSFAVAVVGAVPQYIDVVQGFIIGVKTNQVSYAQRQNELFVRNIDCNLSLEPVTTDTRSVVSVGACPTGDIQVNIGLPNSDKTIIRWFGFQELVSDVTGAWSLVMRSANAKELPKNTMVLARRSIQVKCQRMLSNGKLLRIVQKDDKCYEQTINTYTGEVEKEKQTSCDSSC